MCALGLQDWALALGTILQSTSLVADHLIDRDHSSHVSSYTQALATAVANAAATAQAHTKVRGQGQGQSKGAMQVGGETWTKERK